MARSTDPIENTARYAAMLLVFVPIIAICVIFLMSQADRDYLAEIVTAGGEFGGLIALFFYMYGTPAYVIILLVAKTSDFMKIGIVRRSLNDLEKIASIPLALFTIGFNEIYFLLRHIGPDEEKHDLRHKTANAIGFVIFAAFYARQLQVVAVSLALVSMALYFVSAVWNLFRNEKR